MKRILRSVLVVSALFLGTSVFGQYLPASYSDMFDEIVENFETIRGKNSVQDGKTSLRLLSEDKIILRLDHKRKVKTLTFITKKDEEGSKNWVAGNQLTIDMVNKYEKDLTKVLTEMLEITREEAKI